MSKQLRIQKYDPSWAIEFEKIKQFLDRVLNKSHKEIHHIGSTSVPGMHSKPIIDIDIEYTDNFEEIIQILEDNNYIFEGEKGTKDRFALTYSISDLHEHHLYVIESGKRPLLEHIALKNALISSSSLRIAYSTLKIELISKNNQDRELYTNSKTELITKILSEVKK